MNGVVLALILAQPVWQESIEEYRPRDVQGWRVMVHQSLEVEQPELLRRVMLGLEHDLDVITAAVPEPALHVIQETVIWVELQGAMVPGGMSGRGMCYHVSEEWLTGNGLLAEKTGGIEVVRAADFPEWRKNQPYMVLHELAHAYHHAIGPEIKMLSDAYRNAVETGLYDAVEYNVSADGSAVRAYAATNTTEYFAELSEAYFGLNDFFPFTRRQLEFHDPQGTEAIKQLWSLSAAEIAKRRGGSTP